MATNFKNINYGKMLYEGLRNYFSVNAQGNISYLFKFLAACIQPLQVPFDEFVIFRTREAIIANCKWQMGQLTNTLNYLFDPVFNSIYITQSVLTIISDPMFQYAPVNFDSDFGTSPEIFERRFSDKSAQTNVIINLPVALEPRQSEITAVINQINVSGVLYTINFF